MTNWKTTALGASAVLTAGGHLLHAVASGDFSTIATDLPALLAGIGLLFAPDASKVVQK